MANTGPRTYAIELTVDQLIAITELIRSKHADHAHYAARRDDELPDRWMKQSRDEARQGQATLSALHAAVTGTPLEPTPENPAPVDDE